MKLQIITILSAIAIIISSCGSSKKATGSAEASLNPGDAELKAIQGKYADVTMQTLNDGYAVYTGPCTKCHGQKNIFSRSEDSWQKAINSMAPKAKITDAQKDALWKYILAMKAARPNQTK